MKTVRAMRTAAANALGANMDMSDKIVAVEVDELEHDREQLREESVRPRPVGLGHFAGISVGRKLQFMFGAAAAAAGLLGAVALFGIAGSDRGVVDGLLITMSLIAMAVALIAGLSIRFVQNGVVHPLEDVCEAMRQLAEGNRDVF